MGEHGRAYRSPLRDQRAAETREAILRAARRCFEADGFAPTTVKHVATEAGVSPATIYATFGSKAALVHALLDQVEADAALDAVQEPSSADERYTAWLAGHGRIFDSARDLLRVALQALGEAEVAEMAAEGDRHRREALDHVMAGFEQAGALRPGMSHQRAVDEAWAVSSPSAYLLLLDRCGWTHAEYLDWLDASIRRLVLVETE